MCEVFFRLKSQFYNITRNEHEFLGFSFVKLKPIMKKVILTSTKVHYFAEEEGCGSKIKRSRKTEHLLTLTLRIIGV